MNSTKMKKVVDKYIAAINEANIDQIREIFAETAIVEDPVGSELKEGIEAIAAFFGGLFEKGAQAELIGSVRCAGNAAAFPFTITMGPVKVEPIDVFEFDDEGKIGSMKAYWGPENVV